MYSDHASASIAPCGTNRAILIPAMRQMVGAFPSRAQIEPAVQNGLALDVCNGSIASSWCDSVLVVSDL